MRWLLAIVVASVVTTSGSGIAFAKKRIVVMEPAVVYACRPKPTWGLMLACLKGVGTATVVRDLPDAHVVTLTGNASGIYLYVHRDNAWKIGGIFEMQSVHFLDAKVVKLGTHTGYQIDLGLDMATTLDNEGGGSEVVGRIRSRHTLMCGAVSYRCTDLMTRCEAFARGRAYYAFRGTVSLSSPNEVALDGDRSRAGAACASEAKQFLGWGP